MRCYIIYLLVFLLSSPCLLSAAEWFTYDRCKFVSEEDFDGDSFAVKPITGYTYLFCLYGVDCPVTDDGSETQLAAQMKDFKRDQEEIIEWGEKAAEFTRDFLQKPFRVYTQKIKAGKSSGKSRYYVIIVNQEGKRLDEALVEAGLARVDGVGAEWDEPMWEGEFANFPRRMTARRYLTSLRLLERKAKRERIGIWGR